MSVIFLQAADETEWTKCKGTVASNRNSPAFYFL